MSRVHCELLLSLHDTFESQTEGNVLQRISFNKSFEKSTTFLWKSQNIWFWLNMNESTSTVINFRGLWGFVTHWSIKVNEHYITELPLNHFMIDIWSLQQQLLIVTLNNCYLIMKKRRKKQSIICLNVFVCRKQLNNCLLDKLSAVLP